MAMRQTLPGKVVRISAWQRYALFVFIVGIVYVIAAMAIKTAVRQALHVQEPVNSKAPSIESKAARHFEIAGAAGGKLSNRFMQSADEARKVPWVEMVSGKSIDEPRVFIVHDLLSEQECQHLIALALKRGLQNSLITPYGSHELVESSTRTNKQAWLEFGEDKIVKGIEERIAQITQTYPEQGENLQVLHYDKGQQFTEHHDYFDPATDPPDNYEKGGNRLITLIMYLAAAEEGGETEFQELKKKIVVEKGSAVMFYNLKHGCDGVNPACVDKKTQHAGTPPIKGEKWVATKWIRERAYQNAEGNQRGCFDKHPSCHAWSSSTPSECKLNPTWMKNNCNRSCKYCNPSDNAYLHL